MMLTVEQYLDSVLEMATLLPSEECPVNTGFGRVLASDLLATYPVPPFTNSAMDGFAVQAADLTEEAVDLVVVGDIPAGATSTPVVSSGQAARIMTGAPLPPGADTVIPVENTDQPVGDAPLPTRVEVAPLPLGKNVRYEGEDVRVGDLVLPQGTLWTPMAAAAAVSVGYAYVPLTRRPRVAVISTGSELAPPGDVLNFGQIPDSNSVLLAGLVRDFGGDVVLETRVSDEQDEFRECLKQASVLGADVVVTSGAVSAGAFEVVRQTLEDKAKFVRVAMQPGKPQACGRVKVGGQEMAFLGLPGNPVSVFVSAWVFLRPLLLAFQGASPTITKLRRPSLDKWKTPPNRRQYIPVVFDDHGVRRAHKLGSGSHLVASLPLANGLAVVPEDVEAVNPGDLLDVYPLF